MVKNKVYEERTSQANIQNISKENLQLTKMDYNSLKELLQISDADAEYLFFMNSIVNVIKEKRNSENLSQEELAERIGITKNSIARFERRSLNPSLETLFKIVTELGLKITIS